MYQKWSARLLATAVLTFSPLSVGCAYRYRYHARDAYPYPQHYSGHAYPHGQHGWH